jgi:hypothetical protein
MDHLLLEKVASPIYTSLVILLYATYIAAALGLWYVYPDSVHVLTNAMQIFIAAVLILRFHPFQSARKHLHTVDHQFIVASAVMLLVNAGVTGFLTKEIMGA